MSMPPNTPHEWMPPPPRDELDDFCERCGERDSRCDCDEDQICHWCGADVDSPECECRGY